MSVRQQLTLFVPAKHALSIEQARQQYNPAQAMLIAAHVTLCREDELLDMNTIRQNLLELKCKSISINFGAPARFNTGKGVLLPAIGSITGFQQLRKDILHGAVDNPRLHHPHITLMHPRNSTCTDAIFEHLSSTRFPGHITFDSVYLIEQMGLEPWRILQIFALQP